MNYKIEIPIVFATDENYVPYCGVAIQSLIDNSSDNYFYKIFIMYDELPDNVKYRLSLYKKENVSINFLCIHEEIVNMKITEHNHLSVAATYRLLIPKMLNQFDKVIYLDSDIVVLTDIGKLYEIKMDDYLLCAVNGFFDTDFFMSYTRDVLRINHNNFFNSGVLLINIFKFNEDRISEKCFDLLTTRDDLIYMDQCALNIICEGRVKFLPREWNYEWNFLFEKDIDCKKFWCDIPYILHYDGMRKPWDYVTQIYAEEFWKYARRTIFYEEIIRKSSYKSSRTLFSIISDLGKIDSVCIYGAGSKGRRLVEIIKEHDLLKISAWVDQDYKNIKSNLMKVESIDKIYERKYDYVFIAIENDSVVASVTKMLIENGIEREKIRKVVI